MMLLSPFPGIIPRPFIVKCGRGMVTVMVKKPVFNYSYKFNNLYAFIFFGTSG